MFNQKIYENSRPEGIGVLEIGGEREEKEPRLFVPLKRTELRGEIVGPLAALSLVQTYAYSREQCDAVLEAVYRFPLPGDAAVTGVRVRFGEVEIVTTLQEREAAEAEYGKAVQEGRQAALLTRESPDVFTLHVAGIQPDQDVVVETRYVQLARPRGEEPSWLLRVPLTTAPRYVREDEAGSRHACGQPLALLRDPGHRFSLDLMVRDAGEVSSPTHHIDVTPEGGAGDARVRLHEGEAIPDRDFILRWTPRQEEGRPSLSVMHHRDGDAGQVYFLALVAPPATHPPGGGAAREVILLVDHSGSMEGPKWAASDWAVNSYLSTLRDRDQFALGLFHSSTKWFSKKPSAATAQTLERAARWLDENRDSGGTNLGVALEQALHLARTEDEECARHVLIVTDAQVSDAARITRLADEEARHPARRRISVLCIDAAPNAFLANELARRGGGSAIFLTSDPDQEDITTALEDVLAEWAEPALVGLRLEVNRGGGEAAGREVRAEGAATTIDLGDLPQGRAIWVAGRVPEGEGKALTFSLSTGQEKVASHRSSVAEDADRPALKALFGARRIVGLEYLMHAGLQGDALTDQLARLGYDPRQVTVDRQSSVYVENAARAARDALRPLLVSESLSYGLVCAETAFVGSRTEQGQPVQDRVIVANALPSGWSDAFLSAPMAMSAAAPAMRSMPRSIGLESRGLLGRAAMQFTSAQAAPLSMVREPAAAERGRSIAVFAGRPQWDGGQATLWDSTVESLLPDQGTIARLEVRFASDPGEIDRGLALLVYVEDMAMPRARIRLADLVRLGGERPLNLRKGPGQAVRVVLVDPNGAWAAAAPEMTVRLTVT